MKYAFLTASKECMLTSQRRTLIGNSLAPMFPTATIRKTHQKDTSMKLFIYSMSALVLLATAEANDRNKEANEKAKQKEAEKQKAKEARDQKREGAKAAMEAKDKNKDGNLSLEEYIDGEADPAAATKLFDKYNKNKDRWLSKGELADSLEG